MRLFNCVLWSPAGNGMNSWLSFVVSNCEFVTFPLVCWARWISTNVSKVVTLCLNRYKRNACALHKWRLYFLVWKKYRTWINLSRFPCNSQLLMMWHQNVLFPWSFQGCVLLWIIFVSYAFLLLCAVLACLFLVALWSPAGKGLTSWLSCLLNQN